MVSRCFLGMGLAATLAMSAPAGDPWLERGVATPHMQDDGAVGSPQGEREAPDGSKGDRPVPRVAGHAIASTPAGPTPEKSTDGAGGSWLRSTLALASVLGVIGALTIASRRWVAPRIAGKPGLIHILGRTPLSARQSLCLVRVGPQAVLVGVCGDRMTALSVIDDPAVTATLAGQALSAAGTDFGKSIKSEEHEFETLARENSRDRPHAEPVAAPDGQLARLRNRLAETIARLSARRTA